MSNQGTSQARARLMKRIDRNNRYLGLLTGVQRKLAAVGIDVDMSKAAASIRQDTDNAEIEIGGLDRGEDWASRWD
jgi:hypothetical protein